MSRSLKCLDCVNSQTYSTEDDLEAHIAYVHMKLTAYECELCEFSKFPTEYTVAKHCAEIHMLRECKIILNYSPENKASQKLLAEKLKLCIEASGSSETIIDAVPTTIANPPINSVMPPVASDHAPALTTLTVVSNRGPIKREAPETPEECLAKRVDTEGSMKRRASQGASEDPLPLKLEPISDDETELEVNREESPETPSSKPPTRVICVLCSANVKSASKSRTSHANMKHGSLSIFECGYCAEKFITANPNCVKRHIRNNHRQVDGSVDENKFIDHRGTLKAELQELRDKCFPRNKGV